ncbi:hypothetical protein JTB14_025204 [Gonioctena quinquepunctata]|nr:hypothetical protein JTB14_025204 [Gonioctena quinquepunctata]
MRSENTYRKTQEFSDSLYFGYPSRVDPLGNNHGVKKISPAQLSRICLLSHLRLHIFSSPLLNPMRQTVRGRGKSSPSLRVV